MACIVWIMKNVTPGQLHDLTPQEVKFCESYLVCNSAEKAWIAAGGGLKGARTTGPRILRKAAVQKYLSERTAQLISKTDNLQDKILAELQRMAFARIEDLITVDENGLPQVDFSKATSDTLAAVTSVATKRRTVYNPKGEVVGVEDNAKFNMADKYRGLELLGNTVGMFKKDEQRVVIDVADRLLTARKRVLDAGYGGSKDEDGEG